ncbi:MAG: hypothetical protein M3Q27_07005, partial [Actinomycetota bacterium]|nr:hypothetical protein [Actinomycetota bacterium]
MSESPQGNASQQSVATAFGPNEWLVEEMYQQYLKDPESVDRAWWDFFADYSPADVGHDATVMGNGGAGTAAPGDGATAGASANGRAAGQPQPSPA